MDTKKQQHTNATENNTYGKMSFPGGKNKNYAKTFGNFAHQKDGSFRILHNCGYRYLNLQIY